MDTLSTSTRGDLSPQKALKLAKTHLENAHKATDPELATMFYNEARAALSRMEQPSMETLLSSNSSQDLSLREEITYVLKELDEIMVSLRQLDSIQQAHTVGDDLRNSDTPTNTDSITSQSTNQVDPSVIPRQIFAVNKRPPAMEFKLPGCNERITDIPQLAYCLGLLQDWRSSPDGIWDPTARTWLCAIDKDKYEIDRLMALATDVITIFTRESIKDIEFLEEAVRLAPVVEKPVYRYLLGQVCDHIEQSNDLDPRRLGCLAQVIRRASTGYLEATDVIKILELVVNQLPDIHQKQLTLSVSRVVDAIADTSIEGLDHEQLDHEQLIRSMSVYLDGLKATSDLSLVYHAAHTYQSLLCITDDKPIWHAVLHGAERPAGLPDDAKAFDVKEIIQRLQVIHEGSERESKEGPQGGNEKSLLDDLKYGDSFECKQIWYPALRTADILLQRGQFTEFKKLAYDVPCRRNLAFQWGLCQRLGDLAASLEWDTKTRLNTVAFLEDIYRNDDVWGKQADIKELVVTLLTRLASPLESVKQAADTVLEQLRAGNPTKECSVQASLETGNRSYQSTSAFLSLATLSTLDRLQDGLGVEVRLHQLRKQQLMSLQNAVYVEPQARDPSQIFDSARLRLMDNVKAFIASNQNVLFLSGSAGSGKSTFSRALERDLWDNYERVEGTIPLYVDMSTLGQPHKDLIGGCLRRLGFTDSQIQGLKAHRKFILICDEYDPTTHHENLYTSNILDQSGGSHVRMVVCCRTEHLGSSSPDCFYPKDRNSQVHPELFQQAVIEPFSTDQVQDYLKQYVSLRKPHWEMDDYLCVFGKDNCLHDLSTNPLLLSLTLDVLPRLVDSQLTLSTKKFNKVDIYDQIVAQWFEKSKVRLSDNNPEGTAQERFTCGNIVQSGIDYLKRLAAAIYKNQGGNPVVEYSQLYSRFKRDEAWKDEFFGQNDLTQALREASPLKRCGNKFQFIHPSFLEYGLALAVYDPQEFKGIATSRPVLARRGSMDSVMSFESNDTDDDATTTVDHGHEQDTPLIWRNFVSDHSILEFLEDRVHQEPLFKQKLMALIELSKTEKKWRTAAANAITILVGAGNTFQGADLRGIQIPGANLNYGIFESAQLQGSDLRKVSLCNARLSKADLTQARMKGVQFGEIPFIAVDEVVNCCAYSPDGKHVAVGLSSDEIYVYSTSSWERIRTLEGHSSSVNSIVFSTIGTLVSGSSDNTVRMWDIETGNCLQTLDGHTSDVCGVAFSPQRDQVASGSTDQSIRLWDVSSGTCQRTLSGHTGAVYSVMFSPNDSRLASGGGDKTVRLWDVETGTLHSTLSGHDGSVRCIAYSPQGHLIASGADDRTVRLWNVESGACQTILRGHFEAIQSVVFSPLGNLVTSGSTDSSIRLWDVGSGSCDIIPSDHNKAIRTVVFSPKGDHILSGSGDKTIRLRKLGAGDFHHRSHRCDESVRNITATALYDLVATHDGNAVRLWDLDTGNCIKTLSGHSGGSQNVALSPSGDQVAFASYDKTVRLWDVETGTCLHILSGHDNYVQSIAYSPCGNRIASGSYNDIRLWDADTGECTKTLSGQFNWVYSVAFSPTDDQIASASGDKNVCLWDVKTWSCIRVFTGHDGYVFKVAFSPKGDMMASGGGDKTIRLWNVKTGACCHVLNGHSGLVSRIAFSPNGDQLASSDDLSVRLWSVGSGSSLDRFFKPVNVLVWRTKSGQDYLVDGRMDSGQSSMQLCWIPTLRFGLIDTTFLDVCGLSELDKRLLIQRGAVNIPALS